MTNEMVVSKADVTQVSMMAVLTNAKADFFCSIVDDGSRASKVKIYNAIQNSDGPLADLVGQTISVVDVVAHPIELVDEETGEVTRTIRCVFITKDGKCHDCVSSGIVQALNKIFNIIGVPSWKDEPVDMKVLQKKSNKNAMFKYLTIELV